MVSADTAGNGAPDIRELNVQIPFSTLQSGFGSAASVTKQPCSGSNDGSQCLVIPWIAQYIGAAYRYAVVLGSIIAVVSIMIGGIMYVVAGANASMISKAHGMMKGPVMGLVLLLGSYFLLQTVNPNLIYLQPIEIPVIKQASLAGMFCSQMADQGFDPSPSDWNGHGDNCGNNLTLTVNAKGQAQNLSAGGQTCISDYCADKNQACIINTATNKYACQSAVMYGTIKYPADMQLMLQCGNWGQALLGKGYYVEGVTLQEVCGDQLIDISYDGSNFGLGETPVGAGKYQYAILGVATVGSHATQIKDACCSGCTTQQAIDKEWTLPIILKVNVHNAEYPLWPSFLQRNDKPFFIRTKTGGAGNQAVLAHVCSQDHQSLIFARRVNSSGKASMSSSLPDKYKRADLNNTKLEWNLDITAQVFNCSQGTFEVPENWSCNNALNCADGTVLDTYSGVCVTAPPACSQDSDCKTKLGYVPVDSGFSGDCSGSAPNKYCDCDNDEECSANYKCANNDGSTFNGNDPCVPR